MSIPRMIFSVDPVTGTPGATLTGIGPALEQDRQALWVSHIFAAASEGQCPNGHEPKTVTRDGNARVRVCCPECNADWTAELDGARACWVWSGEEPRARIYVTVRDGLVFSSVQYRRRTVALRWGR